MQMLVGWFYAPLVLEQSRAGHKYASTQVLVTGESEALGKRPCLVSECIFSYLSEQKNEVPLKILG